MYNVYEALNVVCHITSVPAENHLTEVTLRHVTLREELRRHLEASHVLLRSLRRSIEDGRLEACRR